MSEQVKALTAIQSCYLYDSRARKLIPGSNGDMSARFERAEWDQAIKMELGLRAFEQDLFVAQCGKLLRDTKTGTYFGHPGHRMITTEAAKSRYEVVDEPPSQARTLNAQAQMTPEQLACPERGKIGRTSAIGLAMVAHSCHICDTPLVEAFGPFAKHP